MKATFLLGFLLLVALSNARKKPRKDKGTGKKPDLVIPEENMSVLAVLSDANNKFTVDVFRALKEDGKQNLLFSPGCLGTALSMTLLGAAGKTAKELGKALHWDEKSKDKTFSAYHYAMRQFLVKVLKMNSAVKNKFEIVNRIWLQEDFPVRQEYVNSTKYFYLAPTRNIDFGDPSSATDTINGWVQNMTHDKIKKIIPEGSIDSTTRLVLTNALFFKGSWEIEFNKTLTAKRKFHLPIGSKLVFMMKTQGHFNYSRGTRHCKHMSVIELPYKGSSFSMNIILPDKGRMDEVEKRLDWEKLKLCFKSLKTREVVVSMPRFKVRGNYRMKEVLNALNVQRMFIPGKANFAGMVEPPRHQNLYVDEVFHQAFMKVNEVGAEAASATATVIKERSMIFPIEFNVNRPFFFTIQERTTGALFFFGKVTKP